MIQIGDRVKTPMPVKPPKGKRGEPSQTGTVTRVADQFTVVEMDNLGGMRVTFSTHTLEVL